MSITELLLYVAPSVVLLGTLALVFAVILRRRPYWRRAVVSSLLIGMVVGPAMWMLRDLAPFVPYWVQQLLAALVWPIAALARPVLGDTDPVVLIPFVPLSVAVEVSAIVFVGWCVARLVRPPNKRIERSPQG